MVRMESNEVKEWARRLWPCPVIESKSHAQYLRDNGWCPACGRVEGPVEFDGSSQIVLWVDDDFGLVAMVKDNILFVWQDVFERVEKRDYTLWKGG